MNFQGLVSAQMSHLGLTKMSCFMEVSPFQGRPYRGVPLYDSIVYIYIPVLQRVQP